MCGNDNQQLKLNENIVGQHQLRILTQQTRSQGFLKNRPTDSVNHFALIGLLFKLHVIC